MAEPQAVDQELIKLANRANQIFNMKQPFGKKELLFFKEQIRQKIQAIAGEINYRYFSSPEKDMASYVEAVLLRVNHTPITPAIKPDDKSVEIVINLLNQIVAKEAATTGQTKEDIGKKLLLTEATRNALLLISKANLDKYNTIPVKQREWYKDLAVKAKKRFISV